MNPAKSTLTVSLWTLISRLTGFLRDSVMANFIGASMMSDVIVAATKLPNSFRRLLGEGALTSIFVPMFSKTLSTSKPNALKFTNTTFTYLAITVSLLTIVATIFMESIIKITSPGFLSDPKKFHLTVELARINFGYLATISLCSICGAVLNSIGKFIYFAALPVMFNLGLCMTFLISKNPEKIGHVYSYTCLAIGFLQLIFLLVVCRRQGFPIKLSVEKTPGEYSFGVLLKKMGNGLIGSGIYQVNIFVDSFFASMTAGGVAYLYYSDRISQLPITLVGSAMVISLLPVLSRYIKDKEYKKVQEIHDNAVIFSLFAIIPCFVSILTIGNEIVSVVYERGSFYASDTLAVAKLLKIFSIGFFFLVIAKIYNAIFFANLDTKKPMLISLFCMIINFAINTATHKEYGYICVAYASTISAIFGGFLSLYFAIKSKLITISRPLMRKSILIILANIILFCFQFQTSRMLKIYFQSPALILMIISFTSISIYLFLIKIMRVYSMSEIKSVLKKS